MAARIATDKDYDQIRKIWTYCFNEGEEVENCYFENKYRAENTVVAELDGDVVASIHLNQHTIKLGNKEENVSYVVGVSTLPEARGKGMMKSLMNLSFEEMYNRGQNVSILMPIDFRLYRRFGFENCYDMMEHRINIEDLSAFRIERDFKRAKESDIDNLIDIYNKSNRRLNGYTVRGKQRYENMFKEVAADGGHIYICSDNGVYDGYVIYAINEGKFFVREVYFSNTNALKSILAFIYNHNTQCDKVVIMEDVRNTIGNTLKNPKTSESLLKPFMMGRVVNMDGCFINMADYLECAYNYLEKLDGDFESVVISVKDKYIPQNTANYCLKFRDNDYSFEKLEYNEENADLVLDINQISQLIFGYKDIDDVLDLYDKEINEKKLDILRKVFVKKRNHINEYD
ncbi:GNAT family N-acetyltransferase [Peptacetobacter sp.]|uniref:GNAT family N-acetyltransferase n=1 Tax=unclassified Peptacetobacter TaxID=2991974 RepID=UPI002E77358B|nr:GNAT family N-acetyltransferase [Peptacetobacter sp.]MEE0451698.1 GNAT family N-acetyltransferase [Peptacetobacter sp.]